MKPRITSLCAPSLKLRQALFGCQKLCKATKAAVIHLPVGGADFVVRVVRMDLEDFGLKG